MSRPAARMRGFLPFLLLAALPCLLLGPVVFAGDVFLPAALLRDLAPWRSDDPRSLVPWNPLMWDGMAEFYPWRLFAAQTLRSGFLPLWDPHQFCGTPFLANSQSAVFYPLNLVFCLFPVARAFGVSVLLHLFLTGSFLYLFLRSQALGLGRAAALLGAVAWQLCHWQVAWLALPTFLCVSAWLPLALLLVDRAARRPSAARAAALGLCLGVMLLAGHLQIAFYCLGLVTAYALLRVVPQEKSRRLPLLGAALLAAALALGVAAPQLLPAMELARMSHRAGGAVNWPAYQIYVRLAVPPVNLVTLLAPGFFGSPTRGTYWGVGLNGGPGAYMEDACYAGVLPLLLALAGLFAAWRSTLTVRFFACTAIIALLLALGTPLNALLFFGVPGFAQTGSPGRVLVLWSFCVPVLAAFGLDSLLGAQGQGPRASILGSRRGQGGPVTEDASPPAPAPHNRGAGVSLLKAAAALGALSLLIILYAVVWIDRTAPAGTLTANLGAEGDLWRLPAAVLLGAAAAVYFRRRGSASRSALGGALVLLTAIDLLASGYGFNRTAAPQGVYPVTPLIAFLRAHAAEGRVMPLNRRWSLYEPPPAVLPPNAGMVYGLNDTQGYDSLLTGQYFRFAGALDGGSPAPPENGNLVFTRGYGSEEARQASALWVVSRGPLAGAPLKPVMQDGGTWLYRNDAALPRVRDAAGRALTVRPGPPTRLRAVGVGTGPLTVADQWYPGWVATVNGQKAAVSEAPFIFRTVTANRREGGAGPTALEMRYEPETFRTGLYALCLALGAAAGCAAALAVRGRGASGRGGRGL